MESGATSLVDVLASLTCHHAGYFPVGQQPPRVLSASLERRRLSDLARVRLQLDGRIIEIYIKFHKHPHSPDARVRAKAQREFETLQWLFEAFASVPGCAVVRPIAYFAGCKAVVTEKANGMNLHRLLARPLQACIGMHRNRAEEWCYQAGRWLRQFQELTARPEKERFEGSRLRAEIEECWQRCETWGCSRLLTQQISAWLSSELARAGEPALEVVGQHPDFQPQNILIGPHRVTVLDFTSFTYGPRYHDVACFLTSLDSLLKHPLFRQAQIDCLRASFLRGYALLSLQDPLLRLYRVKAMLDYCARFLARMPASLGSRWIVHPWFRRWVEKQALPELLR